MASINYPGFVHRTSQRLLSQIICEVAVNCDMKKMLYRIICLLVDEYAAESGSFVLFDGKKQPSDVIVAYDHQPSNHVTLPVWDLDEYKLVNWVAERGQPAIISNTNLDERWLYRPENFRSQVEPTSAISVPVLVHEELVGVVTLINSKQDYWCQDHLDIMQAVACLIGLPILNARLISKNHQYSRALAAVIGCTSVANSLNGIENTLDQLLSQTNQALGARITSLILADPQKDQLALCASTVPSWISGNGDRIPVNNGLAGWVVRHGQGIIIPNVSDDPRFDPKVDRVDGLEAPAMICAPVYSKERIVGVLQSLKPQDTPFNPADLVVLNGIGSIVGEVLFSGKLQQEAREADQVYQQLFHNNMDAIIVTDEAGKIADTNRQAVEMIGRKSDELRFLSINDLFEMDQDRSGYFLATLPKGELSKFEAVLKTSLGKHIPVQVGVWQTSLQSARELIWVIRDITERKHLNHLREDLITMVYHDLRAPLANVVSSLEALASRPGLQKDPSLTSLLQIARRSADRLQLLTDSMLEISQLEAGQVIGARNPFKVSVLLDEVLSYMNPSIQQKCLHLEVELSPNLPSIQVNANVIRRVLINLVENAVKYSPTEGKMWVGARREEEHVCLWVKDSGPGIPPVDRERVFDKFTRLNPNLPEGLGLGLAFCRAAVQAHGGRIWVESENNCGSTFSFTLPVTESESILPALQHPND